MGVFKDVVIALDLLWVRDEGDCRVIHDKLVVLEDVTDQADQLAALFAEVGLNSS